MVGTAEAVVKPTGEPASGSRGEAVGTLGGGEERGEARIPSELVRGGTRAHVSGNSKVLFSAEALCHLLQNGKSRWSVLSPDCRLTRCAG